MNRKEILVSVLIFVLAFTMRVFGLSQEIMVDEPTWLERCYAFWINVSKLNFEGTLQSGHPGVPNMILAGSGMILYRIFSGVAYTRDLLVEFIPYARLPIVITISVFLVIIYWLLKNLYDKRIALLVVVLLAIEPFYINFTRLVHVDGLLSVFMFSAILSILNFAKNNDDRYLYLTSFFSSLSFLTKSPSILLLPFIFGVLLFTKTKLVTYLKYILSTVAITVSIWPALWNGPKAEFEYVTKSAVVSVANTHATNVYIFEPTYYLDKMLIHVSPLTLLIISIAILFSLSFYIFKIKKTSKFINMNNVTLFLYSVLFTIALTISAKRGERYILPAFMGFVALASSEFMNLVDNVKSKIFKSIVVFSLILLAVIQSITFLKLSPNLLAYYNPLHSTPEKMGFGEGLDQAASYLNTKNNPSELVVASWYPDIFSKYFLGTTLELGKWEEANVDYVILYKGMMGRSQFDTATVILSSFEGKIPEKIIKINGMDYVWIYKK